MEKWVKEHADIYLRHGGKTARRAMVRRLNNILLDIQQHEPGVKKPESIGRAHIHRYYSRFSHLADSTIRDHYYALVLLWEWLGRSGAPPKPNTLRG